MRGRQQLLFQLLAVAQAKADQETSAADRDHKPTGQCDLGFRDRGHHLGLAAVVNRLRLGIGLGCG